MLVVIGKNLGWADAQTFAHLPPGWSTLYHLARLDQAVFKKLLEQGIIHPALTGQQAKDLVAASRGHKAVERKAGLKQWLKKCSEFVRAHLKDWSPEVREQARVELIRLADELGGAEVGSEQVA
jgi:hypothetical protein